MSPYSIPPLVVSIVTLAVGLFVFIRGRKASYTLVTTSVFIWLFGYALMYSASNEKIALFLARLLYIGVVFIPSCSYHFTTSFLELKNVKKVVITNYVISSIFALLVWKPFFIRGLYKYYWGFQTKIGFAHSIFLAFFLVIMAWVIYLLYSGYKRKDISALTRVRIKYVLLSFSVSIVAATDFLPNYGIEFYPLGFIFITFHALMTTYAIIKYRLMNVGIVMTRAAVYIFIYALTFLIPIMVVIFYRTTLEEILNGQWWIAPLGIFIVLVSFTPYIASHFIRQAEERLLRKQRVSQEALKGASQHVMRIRDLDKLLNDIMEILIKTLGINRIAIYFIDKTRDTFVLRVSKIPDNLLIKKEFKEEDDLIKWIKAKKNIVILEEIADIYQKSPFRDLLNLQDNIKQTGAEVIIPTFIKDKLVGFFALGEKRSGEIYTKDDLDILSVLANQAALAIENAQFLKEREEMQAKLREAEKLKATGELLGSVRHEMFNILNKISTPIQMMQMGSYKDKPEKEKEILGRITKEILLGKGLLKHVDEYKEKSQSDKIEVYNISNLIDSAISHSNDLIEKWHIRIFKIVDPGTSIKGKETLPLVFKHLVINSCYGMELLDETEKRGGDLNFTLRVIEETKEAELTQTDTGSDLTLEIKDHKTMGGELFAEQGKLGGLSLFIARRVIRDHAGSIRIESNDGKGTKFIVHLPLDFTKL